MNSSELKCCIVIPVYKKDISETEYTSLVQCVKILHGYHFYFVTHKKLDISKYIALCDQFDVQHSIIFFPKFYFKNIYAYNALCTAKSFYKIFLKYEYMLIYQLDSYVFRDELEYWCGKNYDYIGAPHVSMEKHGIKAVSLHPVMNGGFSLRKIQAFLSNYSLFVRKEYLLFLAKSFFFDLHKIFSRFRFLFLLSFCCKVIIYLLGRLSFRHFNCEQNEDAIWSLLLAKNNNLPEYNESALFSISSFSKYFLDLNNNKLPFGCHAWDNYYDYIFWKEHITNET